MNKNDFVIILGNISQSMASFQLLITGFGYLLGILFIIKSILQLKAMGDTHSKSKKFVAFSYFVVGALLLFLPSTITVLANTTYGSGSIIEYSSFNQFDVLNSMQTVIKTAGVLWFVRGCVLLTHGSEPESKFGTKGITFIAAGILAMNFQSTIGILNYIMDSLLSMAHMKSTLKPGS